MTSYLFKIIRFDAPNFIIHVENAMPSNERMDPSDGCSCWMDGSRIPTDNGPMEREAKQESVPELNPDACYVAY